MKSAQPARKAKPERKDNKSDGTQKSDWARIAKAKKALYEYWKD